MKVITSAVILVGGAGLRLRPLTEDIPKAMIMIAGKPLLQWIIERLRGRGISNFVLGVAYRKEKIIDYFGDGSKFDVQIRYSEHTIEGGTCQGFKLGIQRHIHDDIFVAMNGDELVDVDLIKFATFHNKHGGLATIAVGYLRSPYGVVQLDGYDIVGFEEKPIMKSSYVSIGTYVFSHDILGYLEDIGDVERTLFPRLASMRMLKAYLHTGFWSTINTIKDLEGMEVALKRED